MRLKKLLSFMLAAIFIVGSFAIVTPATPASAAGKETVQRTIAIVYDNSGSMFMNGRKAWCQALYAIEVFATMMNKGDKLMIYPMNPMGMEGKNEVYTHDGNPLIITEDKQKSLIHTIKSDLTKNSDTHIESIDSAYNGLMKESGEKWLVVLTDGEVFYENGTVIGNKDPGKTKEALETRFSNYIGDTNILYLGMEVGGVKLDVPQISAPDSMHYGAQKASSAEVPGVLTNMCNTIFGRDSLPSNHVKGTNVDFDIPLSKLYVFIQGENIDNVKLSGNGKEYKATQQFKPTYATAGCASQYKSEEKFEADTTLQGCMAVYENLSAGTYTCTSTGTVSSAAFYYEVDGDLQLVLVNANGAVINSSEEIAPGEYTLQYALVDKKGNPLKSDLLGNVNYEISYTVNGENKTERGKDAGGLKLNITEETEVVVKSAEVNFLNGYKIRKTGNKLGFLSVPFKGLKGAARPLSIKFNGGFEEVDADLVGGTPSFLASIIYDGKELTGAELEAVQFNASISGEGTHIEVNRAENGFEIKVLPNDGLIVVPTGEYTISANALITSDTVADSKANASASFAVNKVVDTFMMEVKYSTAVYSIMEIDKAEEIIATFKYNGKQIPEDKFEQMKFNASCDGADLIIKKLPDKRAYSIKIDPDGKLEKGVFTITIEASNVIARSGDELTASHEMGITIQALPQWLVILIWVVALAILALLITLWLRTPVLPKVIDFDPRSVKVMIDGESPQAVTATVTYPKKGKKRTITFESSARQLNGVSLSAMLVPTKDSYRYKPSKDRNAMIVNGSVEASKHVTNVTIGGKKFKRNDANQLQCAQKVTSDFLMQKPVSFAGTKIIFGKETQFTVTGRLEYKSKK
ncbi:MAG: hypothetical protein IKU45_02805 [Clostridia bacterium]|nr:hypothetical protein [Clostridia bacterium]